MAAIGIFRLSFCVIFIVFASIYVVYGGENDKEGVPEAEKWKKKDVRDYSEADMERLFDQWEDADEDELEEDELPEYKRPQPKIDLSKINPNDPEAMLKVSKKGRTLMMFATVSGNPTEKETEEITKIWQSSLFNANVETQRYVVGANRVLFLLKDGAMAWEIKSFLIEQERCEVVTIEGQDFPGKGAAKGSDDKEKPQDDKTEKKKKKTNADKKKKKKKVEKEYPSDIEEDLKKKTEL